MKRLSILVLALLVLLSCSAFAESSDWETVTTLDNESVFFNTQRLNFDLEGNIDFDEKIIFTELGKKDFLEHIPATERSKYRNMSYMERFRTLNVDKVKTNLLMIFDNNDKMISITNEEKPWKTLKPGTIDYSTACKVSEYVQAHYNEIIKRS